jgi:hypothetical protein
MTRGPVPWGCRAIRRYTRATAQTAPYKVSATGNLWPLLGDRRGHNDLIHTKPRESANRIGAMGLSSGHRLNTAGDWLWRLYVPLTYENRASKTMTIAPVAILTRYILARAKKTINSPAIDCEVGVSSIWVR